jgi:hypothetical protein
MSEASKPTYLVDAYSDPVVVRIDGRRGDGRWRQSRCSICS